MSHFKFRYIILPLIKKILAHPLDFLKCIMRCRNMNEKSDEKLKTNSKSNGKISLNQMFIISKSNTADFN